LSRNRRKKKNTRGAGEVAYLRSRGVAGKKGGWELCLKPRGEREPSSIVEPKGKKRNLRQGEKKGKKRNLRAERKKRGKWVPRKGGGKFFFVGEGERRVILSHIPDLAQGGGGTSKKEKERCYPRQQFRV